MSDAWHPHKPPGPVSEMPWSVRRPIRITIELSAEAALALSKMSALDGCTEADTIDRLLRMHGSVERSEL